MFSTTPVVRVLSSRLELVELLRLFDLHVTHSAALECHRDLAVEPAADASIEEPMQALERVLRFLDSQVRCAHPMILTPISGRAPGSPPRSFLHASATLQKRSECPRPTSSLSTSNDGLPLGVSRRLIAWVCATSSRSFGRTTSRRSSRSLKSVAQISFDSFVNVSGTTCG